MERILQLINRLLYYWRRKQFDRDLDEELRFHLDMKLEDNRRNGSSEDEARYITAREFGNKTLLAERSRDMWAYRSMEILIQDLRYGLRSLARTPGFTAVALIALSIGIAANTSIFSMVNAVLLQQLPFKDTDRLVRVSSRRPDRDNGPFSLPDYIDYRDQTRTVEQIAVFTPLGVNLTGTGDPERLQGLRVSANIFQTFGVDAMIGRTLLSEDDRPGSERVVMLSHGLWQRRFGADRNLIGQTVALNGDSYTVVGILPPTFFFPGYQAEIAIPLVADADPLRNDRDSVNFLLMYARLKSGVTRQQAEAEMTGIAKNMQELYPIYNARKIGIRLSQVQDEVVGNFRKALLVLLSAVGLVLLIACSNLANLLLARASARRKEVAIRIALGATRARLIRQLLTESIALALLGGIIGLALAQVGIKFLIALSPASLPRATEIEIDHNVLGFTFVISLLAGVIFGLAPALQSSKAEVAETLKGATRGSSDGGASDRARKLLVISEIALSLVLLIGSGLLIKSFMRLQTVNPGFNTENLLVVHLSLPKNRYTNPETVTNFHDNLAVRIQQLPGVRSVGVSTIVPMSGVFSTVPFTISGRSFDLKSVPYAQYRMINSEYFSAMNIPVLKGRAFSHLDTKQSAPVAVINETLAKTFWPNSNPIGEHLMVEDDNPQSDVEIVGVVGNVKHLGLESDPTYDIYLPIPQARQAQIVWLTNNQFWVVKTSVDPLTLSGSIAHEIQFVDKDVPTSDIKPMEQFLSASVSPRRFNVFLLSVFAAAALLLAVLGLYGLMSYSIKQRTKEIGIRMALGATAIDVLKLVLGQGLKLVLTGIAVGMVAAYGLTRIIASLLFQVSAADPGTFAVMGLILAVIALLASYLPARKATKMDPLIALRAD